MTQVFRADDDIRTLWGALTADGLVGVQGPRRQVQARLALLKAVVEAEDLAGRYRVCAYPCRPQVTMGVAYDPRRYPREQARFALDRCLAEPSVPGGDAGEAEPDRRHAQARTGR